jgi:hypothetical protein
MIKQCNNVLSFIGKLEENRVLYPQSRILGEFSKNTYSSFCRTKKNTGGKRYTVRWIKFGDKSKKNSYSSYREIQIEHNH